jgi:3-dehydroquinate synthase
VAEVSVNLGVNSYTIHIGSGIIASIGQLMCKMELTNKVLIVSDDNVSKLYGDYVVNLLSQAGFTVELFSVAPGEDSKSMRVAMELYTRAIEMGLDRSSSIVALGGGVVGDLAGFVAATYLRGLSFVQIPTTLLAQVDSSVGGKVAVNHELGKNLIGAFYQPRLVVIDIDMLNTLPDRELYAGLSETIKYGIIADQTLFNYFIDNHQQILVKEPVVLTEIIRRCCEIKAQVVERDERESCVRMMLNFGHTIAHAIEASTGFSLYNHGEAVAIGMYGAALLSYQLGLCKKNVVDDISMIIEKFKLPLFAPECKVDTLLPYLERDKKTVGGKTKWVLVSSVGQVKINSDVPENIIRHILEQVTHKQKA